MRSIRVLGAIIVISAASPLAALAAVDPSGLFGEWTGTFTSDLRFAHQGLMNCVVFEPLDIGSDPSQGFVTGSGLVDDGTDIGFFGRYRIVRQTIHSDPSEFQDHVTITGTLLGTRFVWMQGKFNTRMDRMNLKLVTQDIEKTKIRLVKAPTGVGVDVSPDDSTIPSSTANCPNHPEIPPSTSTQQFTAAVTGTSDARVIWEVLESTGGTIDSSGLYTAPANYGGTFHVRAISLANGCHFDTTTINVVGTCPNP